MKRGGKGTHRRVGNDRVGYMYVKPGSCRNNY